ncbi:hypothetical protein SAMN04515692_10874 [Leifsonia sp. CL147]|nr:hypothetical protein SAMN04515694_10862 [Leifsonia sp. CL154]SFL63362.1 hypothetical protein SAMN04515692_10874 [Leifsonia sp. CL147]
MYRVRMTGLSEFEALTHAIGEYTVDTLGKENLEGLQVIANPRESTALVTIALKDQSNDAQRQAIATMFDIELLYADEMGLTYVFVDHIRDTIDATLSATQYSYA